MRLEVLTLNLFYGRLRNVMTKIYQGFYQGDYIYGVILHPFPELPEGRISCNIVSSQIVWFYCRYYHKTLNDLKI